jgi:hypothetical protein
MMIPRAESETWSVRCNAFYAKTETKLIIKV